jgi:hypothetical protein
MTDYRDPDHRGGAPGYSDGGASRGRWTSATWGWIIGIALIILVLIFAVGSGNEYQVADDDAVVPATTGQRQVVPPTPMRGYSGYNGYNRDAPAMRPAPAPSGQ